MFKLKILLSVLAGVIFISSCKKNEPVVNELNNHEKNSIEETNFGLLHNNIINNIVFESETQGEYSKEHLSFFFVKIRDYYYRNTPLSKEVVDDLIEKVQTQVFTPNIDPFNTYICNFEEFKYEETINEATKNGEISEEANQYYKEIFTIILKGNVLYSDIENLFLKIEKSKSSEAQKENYKNIKSVFEHSFKFWSENIEKIKNTKSINEIDDDVYKVATADLLGMLHGSIFGPWGAAVESIIVSAVAADKLNDDDCNCN